MSIFDELAERPIARIASRAMTVIASLWAVVGLFQGDFHKVLLCLILVTLTHIQRELMDICDKGGLRTPVVVNGETIIDQ